MRKVLLFLTLTVSFLSFGQASSKINNAQNKWTVDESPRVLISVDTLNSGTWRVHIKDSIKWEMYNVLGLEVALTNKLNSSSISSWALQPNKPTYSYLELSNRANLSLTGNTLEISGGNSVNLPVTKRQETYSGTSNASGAYSVTFTTPYTVAPNIQANIVGGSANQFITMNVTTTGFTTTVYQRNTVNLLATEVLLGTTVLVNGAKVDVLITEK